MQDGGFFVSIRPVSASKGQDGNKRTIATKHTAPLAGAPMALTGVALSPIQTIASETGDAHAPGAVRPACRAAVSLPAAMRPGVPLAGYRLLERRATARRRRSVGAADQ